MRAETGSSESHTRTDNTDTSFVRGKPGRSSCRPPGRSLAAAADGNLFAVRNRYLDLLRAAAIVRVIVYHLFGWPWLSIVLPAMGLMFALAGSLAAASLDRRVAGRVIVSRLRRLLPPLWLLGLIAVPAMLIAGWARETDGDHPFNLPALAFWILPVGDPPGSDLGIEIWETLWYIRAYVWFLVLSPLLHPLYRRLGWLAVAAPILLMGAVDVTGFALPETADAALWDFVTYGACWIAGFAHHDGRLRRMRPPAVLAVAAALGGAALYWLSRHQGEQAWDLNGVPESQALWSLAFVLVALRWQPPMDRLARGRGLDRAVTLVNARAVTVYLWHNIAIAAVWPVLTLVALDDLGGPFEGVVDLAMALALTLVAVLLFGWVEDLAARRRPRLWPVLRPAGPPRGDQPLVSSIDAARPMHGARPVDAARPMLDARPIHGARPVDGARLPEPGVQGLGASARLGRHAAPDSADSRDLGHPVAGRRTAPWDPSAAPLPGNPPDATDRRDPDWFRPHPAVPEM